jgi:hypothetical protein
VAGSFKDFRARLFIRAHALAIQIEKAPTIFISLSFYPTLFLSKNSNHDLAVHTTPASS